MSLIREKTISLITAVSLLLLFFLPWAEPDLSGYQLAVNQTMLLFGVPGTAVLILLFIGLGWQQSHLPAAAPRQAGLAAVGLLITLFEGWQLQNTAVSIAWGWWLAVVCWVVLIGVVVWQWRSRPKTAVYQPKPFKETWLPNNPITAPDNATVLENATMLEVETSPKRGLETLLETDLPLPKPQPGPVTDVGDLPPIRRSGPKTDFAAKPVPQMMAWLVVSEGPQKGQRFRLYQMAVIGRDPRNEVVLDDGAISARHAQVKQENGRFYIQDLNSTNGIYTYRADKDRWDRTEFEELFDSSQVRIGRTTLHLMVLEE